MKLCNEREQIKRLISDFLSNPHGPARFRHWQAVGERDRAAMLQQRWEDAKTAILALDPETVIAEDIYQIQTSTGYSLGRIEPKYCNECSVQSWDIVDIGNNQDYDRGAHLCGNCLEAALRQLRQSRARRNESRKALNAIASLSQESDDYGDDYGETARG